MKTVSVTEFSENIKKYLDIAVTERLVVLGSKGRSFVVTPLENEDDECLLNDSQKRGIDEALEQVANRKVHTHEQAMSKIKAKFPKYFK